MWSKITIAVVKNQNLFEFVFFSTTTIFALLIYWYIPTSKNYLGSKKQIFSRNKLCNDSDIKTQGDGLWVSIDDNISLYHKLVSVVTALQKIRKKPLRNNTVAMEFISRCQRDFTAFNKICRHIDFTLRRHRWCIFSL